MTLSFAAGFDGRILLQSVRHAEQKDGIMSADTCSLIENVRKIAQNISFFVPIFARYTGECFNNVQKGMKKFVHFKMILTY